MGKKKIIGILVILVVVVLAAAFSLGGLGSAKERSIADVSYIGFKADEWLTVEFTVKSEEQNWVLAYELKANNASARFSAYLLDCDAKTFLSFKSPTEWQRLIVWRKEGGPTLTGEIPNLKAGKTYTFIFKSNIGSLGAYKLTLKRP
jgi:hypothetical protein